MVLKNPEPYKTQIQEAVIVLFGMLKLQFPSIFFESSEIITIERVKWNDNFKILELRKVILEAYILRFSSLIIILSFRSESEARITKNKEYNFIAKLLGCFPESSRKTCKQKLSSLTPKQMGNHISVRIW